MTKPRVGIIVGSNRRESINRRLAKALARLESDRLEFDWIGIDDLPMYNQDLEGDRPGTVRRFTTEVAQVPALLFVTPEHNRSIPAVLKNAIDWGLETDRAERVERQDSRDNRHVVRGDRHRGRPAAPAPDPRHPRRHRDGRRGVHLVPPGPRRPRRQLSRRQQAHVLQGLHGRVRVARRTARVTLTRCVARRRLRRAAADCRVSRCGSRDEVPDACRA